MFPRCGEPADGAVRHYSLVKTLLVDADQTMLQHCVTRVGGRLELVVATSKAQVMELLRHGPVFGVIVACECLADGSGLALLDEVHGRWPHLSRVFCTDRQRLARMLESMAGLGPGGVRDALTRYTHAVTGAYYFVPASDRLAAFAPPSD